MLIVNADDWGLRAEVTDAILACWRAGAVGAASAMVHMEDSERAFGLAEQEGLPLGLHLNLTTPFTAAAVPAGRRRRQRAAVEYFAGARLRRRAFDPRVRALLDECVADQLEAFAAARGRRAAHADGHQHIQVCPTVLSSGSLGELSSLRRAHGFVPGQSSSPKRAYRGLLNLAVARRFRSVPFVSLRDVHPALGGVGLDGAVRRAWDGGVEMMVHPAWDDEREVLGSAAWLELLAAVPTGSHADLP